VAFGLALALVLPGFALLALLRPHWPATVMEWAERLFLSVLASIAIVVLAGALLVYGPWRDAAGRGLFQGSATGAPVLEALLGGLTLAFALGAWWRMRRAVPYPAPAAGEAEAHRAADALEQGEGDPEQAARDLYG
jgi:uncharacterized membrane protein